MKTLELLEVRCEIQSFPMKEKNVSLLGYIVLRKHIARPLLFGEHRVPELRHLYPGPKTEILLLLR